MVNDSCYMLREEKFSIVTSNVEVMLFHQKCFSGVGRKVIFQGRFLWWISVILSAGISLILLGIATFHMSTIGLPQ